MEAESANWGTKIDLLDEQRLTAKKIVGNAVVLGLSFGAVGLAFALALSNVGGYIIFLISILVAGATVWIGVDNSHKTQASLAREEESAKANLDFIEEQIEEKRRELQHHRKTVQQSL